MVDEYFRKVLEPIANIIEGRILNEQRKHSTLDWIKIVSFKLASDLDIDRQIVVDDEHKKFVQEILSLEGLMIVGIPENFPKEHEAYNKAVRDCQARLLNVFGVKNG